MEEDERQFYGIENNGYVGNKKVSDLTDQEFEDLLNRGAFGVPMYDALAHQNRANNRLTVSPMIDYSSYDYMRPYGWWKSDAEKKQDLESQKNYLVQQMQKGQEAVGNLGVGLGLSLVGGPGVKYLLGTRPVQIGFGVAGAKNFFGKNGFRKTFSPSYYAKPTVSAIDDMNYPQSWKDAANKIANNPGWKFVKSFGGDVLDLSMIGTGAYSGYSLGKSGIRWGDKGLALLGNNGARYRTLGREMEAQLDNTIQLPQSLRFTKNPRTEYVKLPEVKVSSPYLRLGTNGQVKEARSISQVPGRSLEVGKVNDGIYATSPTNFDPKTDAKLIEKVGEVIPEGGILTTSGIPRSNFERLYSWPQIGISVDGKGYLPQTRVDPFAWFDVRDRGVPVFHKPTTTQPFMYDALGNFVPNRNYYYRTGWGIIDDAVQTGRIRVPEGDYKTEALKKYPWLDPGYPSTSMMNHTFPYFSEGRLWGLQNFKFKRQADDLIAVPKDAPGVEWVGGSKFGSLLRDKKPSEVGGRATPLINGETNQLPLSSAKLFRLNPQTGRYEVTSNVAAYPGYQLSVLMQGSPMEKLLSKTGEISIKPLLQKAKGIEKEVIDKVLKEKFPKQTRVNYNELKKAVQEELVTYDRNSDAQSVLNIIDTEGLKIWGAQKSRDGLGLGLVYKNRTHDGAGGIITTWNPVDDPIRFSQYTFESPLIKGRTGAHYSGSPLGHIRTFINDNEPNILYVMENQSDWGQKSLGLTKHEKKALQNIEDAIAGRTDKGFFTSKELEQKKAQILSDAAKRVEGNSYQAQYLHDNYFYRQLQESLKLAAEKSQTKMRYPTRETAAKIEGYRKTYPEPQYTMLKEQNQLYQNGFEKGDITYERYLELTDRVNKRIKELEGLGEKYSDEHETILRKYDKFPNMFKKLYKDSEVRIVTDNKGNTWYEVDVPKDYLNQEWKYKQGGVLKAQGGLSLLRKGISAIGKFKSSVQTGSKIASVGSKAENLGIESSYVIPFLQGTKPMFTTVAKGYGHNPEEFNYIDELLKGFKHYDYVRPWSGGTQTLRYYINEDRLKQTIDTYRDLYASRLDLTGEKATTEGIYNHLMEHPEYLDLNVTGGKGKHDLLGISLGYGPKDAILFSTGTTPSAIESMKMRGYDKSIPGIYNMLKKHIERGDIERVNSRFNGSHIGFKIRKKQFGGKFKWYVEKKK